MSGQRRGALNAGSIGLITSGAAIALLIGFYAGRRETPSVPSTGTLRAASAAAQVTKKSAATKPVKLRQPHVDADAAASPLPAPGTPLRETFADLQSRADSGDAAAASRLYRDLQRCAQIRNINATVPHAAAYYLNEKTDGLTTAQLQSRDSILGRLQKELNFAGSNSEFCAGLTDAQMQALVPVSMQAALGGDANAADCYLGWQFAFTRGILDHPEWLSQYKENALNIANAALQNGDWTSVRLLQGAYSQSLGGGLLSQVTGVDTLQNYRYLKLLRLGAQPGKDATYFDNEINAIAPDLGTDAQLAADAWAQGMYQRYFAANPQSHPPSNNLNNCPIDGL